MDNFKIYGNMAMRQKFGSPVTAVVSFAPTTSIVSTITGVKWFFMTSSAVMLVTTSSNVARTVTNWKTAPAESANISGALYGTMGRSILPNGGGYDIHLQSLNSRRRSGMTYTFNETSFSGPNNVLSYTYAGSVGGLPSSVSKYIPGATKYRNISVGSTSPYAMSISYLGNGTIGVDAALDPSNPPTISSIATSALDTSDGTVLALRRFNSAASPNRTIVYKVNYETMAIITSYSFGDDYPLTGIVAEINGLVIQSRFLASTDKTDTAIFDTQLLTQKVVSGCLIGQFNNKLVVFRLNQIAANKYGDVYLVDPLSLTETHVTDVTYSGVSPISGAPTLNNFMPIMPFHGMYPIYVSGSTSGNVLSVVEIS